MSEFFIPDQPRPGPGRPKTELNEDEVYSLARMGCTFQEIADFFGVHRNTIITNYTEAVHLGWAHPKISIRRHQLRRAEEGSDTMLIWLGKQMLGQRDYKDDGAASKAEVESMKQAIKEVLPVVNFHPSIPVQTEDESKEQ